MALEGFNLQKIQAGDENEFREVFRRFGCAIKEGPTFEEVKIYPFERIFPVRGGAESDLDFELRSYEWAKGIVDEQLAARAWAYKIFGPDENGQGFSPPDFMRHNYGTRCVWIFQPCSMESAGSESSAWNLLWSISHELAHALTNDGMTEKFGGIGRRRGALGIETRGSTFSTGHARQEPLSLVDALRAIEWEHHAAISQRAIVEEDYGIQVGDPDFCREHQRNIAASVIRTLWGGLTTPAELGVLPQVTDKTPEDMNQLAQDMCREAAQQMGLDMKERFMT